LEIHRPGEFEAPGVRLHAAWLSSGARVRWSEASHQHDSDEVTILLAYGPESLAIEVTGADETAPVCAPAAVYVPENLPHRYRHVGGEGLALKFLRLPSKKL
jgi:hypothetical protein